MSKKVYFLPSTAQIFCLTESGCLLTYTVAPVLDLMWVTNDPCLPISNPTRLCDIRNWCILRAVSDGTIFILAGGGLAASEQPLPLSLEP